MQACPGKQQISLVIDHIDSAATMECITHMHFCLLKDVTASLGLLQSRTHKHQSKQPFSANDVSFVVMLISKRAGTLHCHQCSMDFSRKQQAERLISPGCPFWSTCT